MTEAMKFLHLLGWSPGREFDDQDFASGRAAQGFLERARIRDEYIAKFGFAILDDRTVEALKPYGPFLEVGAGTGYWSYELRAAGVESLPTDPGTGVYALAGGVRWGSSWCPVEQIDGVSAVQKYPGKSLLIVWPDYANPWPAQVLEAYRRETVAYVGEGEGGCTADGQFHRLLEQHFSIEQEVYIHNFFGVHDALTVYRRNREVSI